MSMSTTTHTGWPAIGSRVAVRLDCCTQDRLSRVEDYSGEVLTLSAPTHPCGASLPSPGTPVSVAWTSPAGVFRVLTTLVGTQVRPRVTWSLQQQGEVHRIQRREFVRVPKSGFVLLSQDDTQLVKASLVDISEGGMRCVVGSSVHLQRGAGYEASFKIDDDEIQVRVEVVWSRLAHEGLLEAGLRFLDLSRRDADRIRKVVYVIQVRLRARGLA